MRATGLESPISTVPLPLASSRSSTTPLATRRADIQGLRALAVILVVAFHVDLPLPGGFVGVDIFFVISGFVITGVLMRELAATGTVRFREFYARRFRRLLPPFALVSLTTLAGAIIVLSPTGSQQEAANTSISASLFGANVYLFRFGRDYFNPNDVNPFVHMWSLSVEEQIYFVLPVFCLLVWTLSRRLKFQRRAMLIALFAVAVGSFAIGVSTTFDAGRLPVPLPEKFAFYLPFSRVWEFLAGALLAVIGNRLKVALRPALALSTIGFAAIAFSAFQFNGGTPFPGFAALLPVGGTCAMLIGGTTNSPAQRAISWRPLVWVGDVSYEWYLWHWPAIVFASLLWPGRTIPMILAGLVTLPLAALSKYWITDHFRFNDRLRGRRSFALVAVCVLVPIATAAGVKAAADRGWGNPSLQELVDAQRRSRSEAIGCDSVLRREGCLFTVDKERTIVLVGDSQAAAISDMVADVTTGLGANFAIWTRPGCRYLLSNNSEQCTEWAEMVSTWLSRLKPDIVVFHSAVGYPSAAKAQEYADGFGFAVSPLVNQGSSVVFLEDVPYFASSNIQRATIINSVPAQVNMQRSSVVALAAPLREALERELGSSIAVVKSVESICEPDVCTQRADQWLYRDSGHLTPAGANRLRPGLTAALQEELVTLNGR